MYLAVTRAVTLECLANDRQNPMILSLSLSTSHSACLPPRYLNHGISSTLTSLNPATMSAPAPASSSYRLSTFTTTFLPPNHYRATNTSCSICHCADRAVDPPWTSLSSQMTHISPTHIIRTHDCNHIFHELCLHTWVATQLESYGVNVQAHHVTCPMCRTVLLRQQDHSPRDLVAEIERHSEEARARLRRLTEMEKELKEAREELRRVRAEMDALRE
jgi:hypothetical protein